MNTTILPQPAANGANSNNIIDLAEYRRRRDARDAVREALMTDPDAVEAAADAEEAASLRSIAEYLLSPSFPDGAPPVIRQTLSQMEKPSVARAEVRAKYVAVPDISTMSFEECSIALRAIGKFPFSRRLVQHGEWFTDILFPFMQPLWSALVGRLYSLDKKKASRLVDSVMNSAERERRPAHYTAPPSPRTAA